jgi:drug/metabolite transporter (DMT)-like permease
VNLIPVVTAAAAYFFLGEVLGLWQWLGGALVLGSVLAVGLKETLQKT